MGLLIQMMQLEMCNIGKEFPGVVALENVSMAVERGEVRALVGENGAGKSTLMSILSGIYPYNSYSGKIVFDGETLNLKNVRDSERLGIVIIHQELALCPNLSIAENIFLRNERKGRLGFIDWPQTHEDAISLMARVSLKEHPSTPVQNLGVGKQQLVEIAKAMSKRVRLLILDEPTAALNDEDSEHLLELIRQLKHQGITVIIISHKLNEVLQIADAITVIRDGKTVETISRSDASESRIITGMVGREMDDRYPHRISQIGDEIFRIEDWTVHHPDDPNRKIIDAAELMVQAGEVVGISGLIGAGRTELALSIFGRSYGSRISGRAYVHGREVALGKVCEAMRNGIGYATEDRKLLGLNLISSIQHNISIASLRKIVNNGLLDEEKEFAVAERYRDLLQIKAPSVASITGKLSGGNQQKVMLSRWMFADPEILILDEPTRGIDVGAKYEIYTIINELAAQGKGIIVISSDLPELLGISDRIYAIAGGSVTGQLPKETATPEKLMRLMAMEKIQ